MRIAYVCADPGVPVFGQKGCSIHAQEVLRAMRALGAEVVLFATRTGGAPPGDLESIPVCQLPKPPKGDPAPRELAALNANGPLGRALESLGPFDMVYERYSLWSFAAMEFAHNKAIPGLLEVNAPLINEQAEHRCLVHRDEAERVAHRVFSSASALLAVSQPLAEYLHRYPCARGRVHVVPNGVNPDRFPENETPAFPRSADTFTIGFLGTLKPWHGLDTLIDATAKVYRDHPSTRLLIVGDGTEKENLLSSLEQKGLLDITHLTGSVSAQAVSSVLACMDVAVAPYPERSDFYFSPLKVYEYMAAGLPVVASRIGQLEDLIEEGVTGLLTTPGAPDALAEALTKLRLDAPLRRRMGNAARKQVLAYHTWASVVQRVFDIAGVRQAQPVACK